MNHHHTIVPLTLLGLAVSAIAEDSDAEIAKKLSNPVASMISVPFQMNWDFGLGPLGDGTQFKLNFQPVIPLTLNDEWKLIVRTIVPYLSQEDVFKAPLPAFPGLPDSILNKIPTEQRSAAEQAAEKAFDKAVRKQPVDKHQDGLGDIVQSFFFSPQTLFPEEYHFGIGPVFSYPTATDDLLGSEQWSLGPTVLFLGQARGWTAGVLANHLWSVAGDDSREDVNATSIQPFLSYQTKAHTTIGINAESAYDWNTSEWTVPLNFQISQLTRIGKMPVSFQVGARYYAEAPDNAPDWGLRATITMVLPEKRK